MPRPDSPGGNCDKLLVLHRNSHACPSLWSAVFDSTAARVGKPGWQRCVPHPLVLMGRGRGGASAYCAMLGVCAVGDNSRAQCEGGQAPREGEAERSDKPRPRLAARSRAWALRRELAWEGERAQGCERRGTSLSGTSTPFGSCVFTITLSRLRSVPRLGPGLLSSFFCARPSDRARLACTARRNWCRRAP